MTIKDWIFVLAISGLGMMTANFIGFDVAFTESLPGVLVLLLIALCAAGLAHVIPLKLPTVAYCSILGLLCACPLSPVSQFVIESAGKINFTAPLTMVGAFAGMSISNQLKMFFKQGWKLIIITILALGSGLFSVAGLWISGYIRNSFAVLASPLLLYYTQDILFRSLLPDCPRQFQFFAVYFQTPGFSTRAADFCYSCGFLLAAAALFGTLFVIHGGKERRNG